MAERWGVRTFTSSLATELKSLDESSAIAHNEKAQEKEANGQEKINLHVKLVRSSETVRCKKESYPERLNTLLYLLPSHHRLVALPVYDCYLHERIERQGCR